jgi:uncharacterized membrane protein (Fun14 family)
MLKQGTTRPSGILTASNMRQVSLGSILGLVVGVGLRAFSRVLVVLLGMGVVFVEVGLIVIGKERRLFWLTSGGLVVGCCEGV